MLKDITNIKIEGSIFESLTQLDLFNPIDGNRVKTTKGNLLYGKNGTGKSTIAKAFRKISGEYIPTLKNVIACDNNGEQVLLSDEEKACIFVFDEEYVYRNVKLQQDHLETIVMLGEVADLTEKIKAAVSECNSAKSEFEQQDKVLREYLDINNVKSPKYQLNQIINALRGDDNWAGRDREIKDIGTSNGRRQNTSVRDDTYLRFLNIVPSKPKTELISDYKYKIKELEDAKTGASIIDQCVPQISNVYKAFDDESLIKILSKVIEKPELSEREKILFSLLQDGKVEELSNRLRYFSGRETLECPYCFQHLTKDYKDSLVKSIEKVLSRIVEKHQKQLKEYLLAPIDLNLTPFIKLDGYQSCLEIVERINNYINNYNSVVKKKFDNPYEPIVSNNYMVSNTANKLSEALMKLEKERLEYNSFTKKIDPILKELDRINSEIAYYDIIGFVEQYNKQNTEYNTAREKYISLETIYNDKKRLVEELEAQRSNVHLAVDAINACLRYIFFAENRLSIIYDNGVYKLLSNGKSIKPCDVSVGERNIIGLSYFFTSILNGKEEKEAYEKEYLLVIDDPISSNDIDNHIGILSFLKYKLSIFLEGNINTKALIMTHDLRTYYDVHKLFEEIIENCKNKGYRNPPKFDSFELSEKKLKKFSYSKRQEYSELVGIIYKYAIGQSDDYELIIGNIMRQVLEAFATFEYKKGIAEVSNNEQILDLLPEKEFVSYFKNLMYRLILNGGSHKEDQVKTMADFNFFSLISDAEKKRTARDILCFIYLLNRTHLIEHLKNFDNNSSVNLDAWCQEIKERAAII